VFDSITHRGRLLQRILGASAGPGQRL